MTHLTRHRSLAVLCCALAIGACQSTSTGTTSSGTRGVPNNAHYFDGKNMNGTIAEHGCRSSYGADWQAKLIDGNIVGHMMSARSDNEPERSFKQQKFSLPTSDDGTFGARSGDGPHRLWLRWWASPKTGYGSKSPGPNKRMAHKYPGKKAKYTWVSGQVLKSGDIKLYIKWGTSDGHGGCYGDAYFRNDISDEEKIMAAVKNAPDICSGDKTALKTKAANLIKDLKADGAIDKSKDYSTLDFRISRLHAKKCKA